VSLAPAVHPDIRGVEGKAHPVNPICVVPGCISKSQQAHHLWARSYLRGQPTEWVRLPSGRVVSNTVGLCLRHHAAVTGGVGGHQAMVRLETDDSFLWLERVEGDWHNMGLLTPQPYSETPIEPRQTEAAIMETQHEHLAPGETCEHCGYTRPKTRQPGPRRPVKTWAALVPDDAEIGADVLDEWIEQFAVVLGFGDDVQQRLVRYHTLVAVLAWAMQHRQEFIADVQEATAA
jgi:hypothetical protein